MTKNNKPTIKNSSKKAPAVHIQDLESLGSSLKKGGKEPMMIRVGNVKYDLGVSYIMVEDQWLEEDILDLISKFKKRYGNGK